MKRALFILGVLLSAGLFCACSKDDNDEKGIYGDYGFISNGLYATECFAPSFSLGDTNVLFIQDETGKIDTCGIYSPYCGTTGPITTTGSDSVAFENYPMVFSTAMWYSANFNELQLGIENRENKKIEDLEVGDSRRLVAMLLSQIEDLEPELELGAADEREATWARDLGKGAG